MSHTGKPLPQIIEMGTSVWRGQGRGARDPADRVKVRALQVAALGGASPGAALNGTAVALKGTASWASTKPVSTYLFCCFFFFFPEKSLVFNGKKNVSESSVKIRQ